MDEKNREMFVGLNCKVEKLEERIENFDQKLDKNTIEIDQRMVQNERKWRI